jgi:phosphoribosyl 1,2-cyclic phosphodiesterase
MPQARAFAAQVGAGRLVTFHHDPDHDDATLDRLHELDEASLPVVPGRVGLTLEV